MRALRFLLAVSCLATTLAATPAIEFTGLMKSGTDTKFALTDHETGASQWRAIGESFHGYTLRAYDAKSETILVAQTDGTESSIRLKIEKVKRADAQAAKLTFASAMAIYNNLRQIVAAAERYYLEHNRNSTALDELVGEGKYIRNLIPVAGEYYGTLILVRGNEPEGNERFAVTTGTGERVIFDSGYGTAASFYDLKAGDTGAKVAASAGISLSDLAALNDGVDFTKLKVRQTLRLR